jgi:hypothetical protein
MNQESLMKPTTPTDDRATHWIQTIKLLLLAAAMLLCLG